MSVENNKLRIYKGIAVVFNCDKNTKGVVYMLTFPNNKKYIGKTVGELRIRIKSHCYDSFKEKNKHIFLRRAIRKYKEFKVDILYYSIKILKDKIDEDICEQEKYFIKNINSINKCNGYNTTNGGEGLCGRKLTKKQIHNLKVINKNRIISDEQRKYLSDYFSIPCYQYDLKGNFIKEWKSQKEASAFYKVKPSSINNAIKENISSCGFQWRKIFTYNINKYEKTRQVFISIKKDGIELGFKSISNLISFFEIANNGKLGKIIKCNKIYRGYSFKKITEDEYNLIKKGDKNG